MYLWMQCTFISQIVLCLACMKFYMCVFRSDECMPVQLCISWVPLQVTMSSSIFPAIRRVMALLASDTRHPTGVTQLPTIKEPLVTPLPMLEAAKGMPLAPMFLSVIASVKLPSPGSCIPGRSHCESNVLFGQRCTQPRRRKRRKGGEEGGNSGCLKLMLPACYVH